MMKSKKVKIIFIILIAIIGVSAVGFNTFLRLSIPNFFKCCKPERNIPGLKDGYIPQGLSYVPEDDVFLSCGYMNNGSASRIYTFNLKNSDYVLLNESNGQSDTTHAGGIAYWNDYVFMAHDNVVAVYDWQEIKKAATEHSSVTAVANFEVGFETAFCYVDGDTLYIGEFYREKSYETPKTHHLVTDNGDEHHALICAYDLNQIKESKFSKITPLYAYSIPDLVQGMCINDSKNICISTSWGLAFSHIFMFEKPVHDKADCMIKIKDVNVPVYYLDSAHKLKDIKIIPMCEEIYCKDGRIFFINESASDKYKFGKFINGNKLYSLKVD